MKVKKSNSEEFVINVECGDLVSVNGRFYTVFKEIGEGYRLNSLSGAGYYSDYKDQENLIVFLQEEIKNKGNIEIFPQKEYELILSRRV